ncbi:ATP-binding protein [Vibrio alginolyticus]|uniref:ATP-binding protein n=1 Tax=Vibrio alginolyticus TaxID=663 RepID=UPI0006A7EB45|nr:ATP-binding protein [Vibrio alginolyticus]
MKQKKWFSPYDPTRRIGSVINVAATELIVNLSKAGSGEPSWSFGNRIAAGEVNEFVFVDIGETAILGRLVKVWIDGGERLSVDGLADKPAENHPIGLVQILVSLNPASGRNYRGVKQHPRLGSQIYSAHPQLVSILAEGKQDGTPDQIHLPLASLPHDEAVIVHVTPEKLFSRHCAILGATGGGKSYSMTNIIEQVITAGGKAIVIDPTGEYESLNCESYYVGNHINATKKNQLTFPHWQFTDTDIRAFLRPSTQSQAPKLEAAIESQKIVWQFWQQKNHGLDITNKYLLNKSGQAKLPYEAALLAMNGFIQTAPWMFGNIAEQIVNECVWPNGGTANAPNATIWGGRADNDVGHCLNLIARIKAYSNNPNLKWMIDPDDELNTVPNLIDEFCSPTNSTDVLRLDLSEVPFEANSREILVNAIGRKLLSVARKGKISHEAPLLVFIDEAHQFLNKRIGEETNRFELDAFGNIAKEGRKYGLNTIIATQRPCDIPEDVLSQIGTLIVHRLTNQLDQEIIKKAVGAIDQRSASFLPVLGQGEALLLGVDFPFPMTVKIKKPVNEPTSKSAKYSSAWKRKVE